jgi:hypothetical protein
MKSVHSMSRRRIEMILKMGHIELQNSQKDLVISKELANNVDEEDAPSEVSMTSAEFYQRFGVS